MNIRALLLICAWLCGAVLVAQQRERDTTYIQPYPQQLWLKFYGTSSILAFSQGENMYLPNYPFSLGVGVGLRKYIGFNVQYAQNIFKLNDKHQVNTRSTDFQLHSYGERLLADAYYQHYTGFYVEEPEGQPLLFSNLSIKQIGVEGTYLWNADRFSARAAFEQTERQIKSAGSWLLGGGFYWHRIDPDEQQAGVTSEAFENYQVGIHGGYAYSWVANRYWLLTIAATNGVNFGNELSALRQKNIKVYPTIMLRFGFTYQKADWSASLSAIVNNKFLYLPHNEPTLRLSAPTVQLSVTKHFSINK